MRRDSGLNQRVRSIVALAAAVGCSGIAAAQDPPARAVLDRYCVGCHNDKLKNGGLTLTAASAKTPADNPELWEKVVRKLRPRYMPPAGLRRPDERGYQALIS